MKWEKGVQNGGSKPGIARRSKEKVLAHWMKIFNERGVGILEGLSKDDPSEFMKIGLALFPKDVDVTMNQFSSWTPEELHKFISTGEYPLREEE